MKRTIGVVVAVCLLAAMAQAQGLLTPYPRLQFFTSAGVVCAGCSLTSSLTGTATASTLYQDSTLLTPAGTSSVVTLDSSGRPTTGLFLSPSITYRLVLKTSAGVTIWTQDGVRGSPAASFTLTSGVIPKADSTGTTLQDSTCLSESGTTVTVSPSCTLAATAISGATVTRLVPGIDQTLTVVSGAPVSSTLTSGGVVVSFVALTSGSNSSVGYSFTVPPEAKTTSPLTLALGYQASAAPGVTNNKVKLTLACQVAGVALSTTAGDTITLANDTVPTTYAGTVNTIAASAYSASSNIDCTILRDTSVANNAAVNFNIREVMMRMVATQGLAVLPRSLWEWLLFSLLVVAYRRQETRSGRRGSNHHRTHTLFRRGRRGSFDSA